jgi:serine/threonine protein kinase
MAEIVTNDRYVVERTVVDRESFVRQICVDRLLGRQVLITRLQGRAGRRTTVQNDFRSGAERAARLNHQHIVAMFDLESENGLPFSIQEYSAAETLRDVIDHEGPFHPDDVATLVEQVASALDYASQRSVHHGALRPDTIVVDYDGTVLVTDFGIGNVLDSIDVGSVERTRYLSPEAVTGAEPTAAADIYSLGVIAYEMLTGATPFDAESVDELRDRIARGYADPPSQVRPEIPPALNEIVLAAIARLPEGRPGFAADLGDALREWRGAYVDPEIRSTETFHLPGFTESPRIDSHTPDVELPSDNGEEETRGSGKLAILLAWLAVLAGIGAIGWIGYSLYDSHGHSGRDPITRIAASTDVGTPTASTTTAPENALPTAASLIGLTLDEASARTSLSVRPVATEASDGVPGGQIIRQSPNPGDPIRNNEIVVVVSSGSGPVDLGSLDAANDSFVDITRQLTQLGLNVQQVDEGSATIAAGRVIRIEEQTANPGDDVHVVVSKGDQVQIPLDIQSMPIADAEAKLKDLGLTVGDPIGVSRAHIEQSIDLAKYDIVDGDVVGIQEADAGFGSWIPSGSIVTPVYYDASLDR